MMKPSFPARVFLVEDHPKVRQELTAMIERADGFSVCGEAEDTPTALTQIIQILPDLVLLDLSLKNSSGLSLLQDLRILYPDLPVLILSIHEATSFAEPTLRAGANGYITKQEAVRHLITALRTVLNGGIYRSGKILSTPTPLTLARL